MGQVLSSSLAGPTRRRSEADQAPSNPPTMEQNDNARKHSEGHHSVARTAAANDEQYETVVQREPVQREVTPEIGSHIETPDTVRKEGAGVTLTLDELMKGFKDSLAGTLQEIWNTNAIPDCDGAWTSILEKLCDDLNTAYYSMRHQHSETLKVCSTPDHLDALLAKICAFFNTTTFLLTNTCDNLEAVVKRQDLDLQRGAANELSLKTQGDGLKHHLLQEKATSEHLRLVAGELQKELDRYKAIARKTGEQLKKVCGRLEEELESTSQARAELIQGQADIQRAKEINKEYERLKTENVRLHRAETEVGSLRKQLNEANIKGLQKRNQDLIMQLQKATMELKKLKDLPSERPDTQGESADTDLASVASRKSFSRAAAGLLRKLKGTLDQLCTQINGMKETRGGSGWGIVERTAGMVTETKIEMTKEIDDCLKLRPRDKESSKNKNTEDLSIEDFPPLPAPAL